MKLILEQRYLFDGSVGAIGHHGTHADHHDPLHQHTYSAALASDEVPGPAARQPAAERATAATANITTVLIVDPSVTNWQSLVAGVKPGVDVVVLNPNQDGITQVTQALQGLTGVKNLEFLTDGTPGAISLGGSTLDMATLTARASDITGWSAHLATNADIVFWGCDVAQGSTGAAFVADVHTLTGATIGASTNAIGAASLGGDWTLDATTGELHRDVMPFTSATLADYTGILDTPLPTVTLVTSDGTSSNLAANTVLLGDQINVSMSFTNQAENAAGFGPYVELFAPNALSLSNVSSGGAALGAEAVQVVNGLYINPLTGQSEAAPSGVTGGSVYFVSLPYGSFTPGEPAVSITAELGLNGSLNTSQMTALVGTTLAIEARAGFEYGAVATGGTPILQATPASSPETVELIESWATVSTMYGEGETATGPDFPVSYVLHLEPAPAVLSSGVPITNLSISFDLPNDVIAIEDAGGTPIAPVVTGGGTASIVNISALGGTEQAVNISFASLSTTQTVSFSAYVPEFYQYTSGASTVGTPILDPATGAAVPIALSPAYTFAADAWNGLGVSGTGDIADATFEAKSLAVQLSEDQSAQLPTQDIHYTLTFEVSDYFGISGLDLSATLGNGLEFDPLYTPLLSVSAGTHGGVSSGGPLGFTLTPATEATSTINNETLNTNGSGAFISYVYDPVTGQTNVSFNVGGLLPGTYGAGTVGSAVFAATVLDAYPVGTDHVAGAGDFLRENDSVSTVGAGTAASLFDYSGSGYSASVGAISDNTDTAVDTLPEGSLSLSVVAIDGVSYAPGATLPSIQPGDIVVYQLVYTLAAPGDFAGLTVSAYLPEPIFSVMNPDAPNTTTYSGSASSNAIFSESGAGATALGSGSYNFTTSYGGPPGIEVGSATANEPANSISFSIAATGSNDPYLNTTTGAGATQTVTIDFAVTASSMPFINGLHLTTQADSTFSPAQAPAFSFQQTQMLAMAEPLLTNVQQGVVSVVDDSGNNIGTAAGTVWTAGASGAVTNNSAASAVFAPAGSSSVFVGSSGPAALDPAVDNLNVAGIQAGDTVRIVDAVQNTGGYAAYDVILKDALSQAFTASDVTQLTFTRGDGTVLVAIDPATGLAFTSAAAEASAFFSTGVLLTVGGTPGTAVLSKAGTSSDIVYATYDVTLPSNTPTGSTLTGQATVVAWTNQDLFADSFTLDMPGGADGNFADVAAVGSNANTLSDTATIATLAPAITDTITGATDGSDGAASVPANTFDTHSATVVPGETVSLSMTITLPQGENSNVTATDILPAGMTLVSGSVVATIYNQDGTQSVLSSADYTINAVTNTLTLNTTTWGVPVHSGGDQPLTVVFTYNALVPQTQSAPIDTTSWGTNAAAGNRTVTDSFAASNEGLSYTSTVDNITAPVTTATTDVSGLANTVTVTNPLVTATISENVTGTVYSGETLTYTLTLTNSSSSATAYDLGSTVSLPSGLTYVANSLIQTGGAASPDITTANVGSNGSAGAGNAVDGITLAPNSTSTFTFQATVNDNLPATTALTVTATPAWESLPASATFDGAGNVNAAAQAYAGAQGRVTNDVAAITPSLSIIGASNDTAGLGTAFDPNGETSGTAVTLTDGEIVRMRAVLTIPEGQNNSVDLVVTLPNGMTFQNGAGSVLLDGSTTIALISPNADLVSSTLSGAGLQVSGTAINLNSLGLGLGLSDPVTASLAGSAISVSGQTVTFNLGQLTNNDHTSAANYVVVEFNAIVVDPTAATTSGNPLSASLQGSANGAPTATVNDYAAVVTPTATLTKTIEDVAYNPDGSATVTYLDTVANTGNSTAYNLALDDPGAGGFGTVAFVGDSGGGTVSGTPTGNGSNHFVANLTVLQAGQTENFTYTVTIPASQIVAAAAASSSAANVNSYALNPALEIAGKETLIDTSLTPPPHTASASAGFDQVSGSVNQDVSAAGDDSSLYALSGQTVAVTLPGGTETVTTDAGGQFAVLVPSNVGPISIVVTTVSPPAPQNGPSPTPAETLNDAGSLTASLSGASVTTTDPATLTFTPASSTPYTGLAFDFYRALDTAPVLANGPTASFTTSTGSSITPFADATVSDTELDGNFAHDYSGTTLTLQRYVGATASPDGTDVFSGSGTLSLSGGNVMLNSILVGTYIQAGGVLTIKFADTNVSNTTVNGVLDQITYTSTAGGNTTLPAIVIGAQIDDANNDPIVLSGGTADPTGPHDQGPGGDLLSNVLTATVTVNPLAPGLSIIGESNVTTGSTQSFDPTGQTTGTAVVTTDGDIVRMRAVVQLPEGTNNAADIVVTLPNGLTFQADGSTDVLLVSPNGNVITTLTGAGLQLAENGTPINTALRSLGTGSADPVTAALNEPGAITVNGQTITFNLGTLTNPTTASGANYVVVEFNAVVGSNQPASATPLTTAMHGDSNSAATATVNDYVTVVAPNVTLSKTVENIVYNPDGTVTVTYVDVETNTGSSPAYNVSLTDPGAGTGTVTYGGTTGTGTVTAAGPSGSQFDSVLSVLPNGGSQTFTFSVTIPASQIATAVADSTAQATVTYNALNPAHETSSQETLAGTSLTPPAYTVTATAGLDIISGTVNQDVSPTSGTDNPLVPLAGQTISVTFGGQTGTETTTTDGSGHYAVLVPDSGVPVTLTVTTTSPNAPTSDSLDNATALAGSVPNGSVSGVNPATLSFTPAANTTYTPIAFDFWRPLDTAPVLANGPGAPLPDAVGLPVVPFANATVSDAELDATFAHDFSGTTLTLQRYNGAAAAPDATDVFIGTGTVTTGVSLSNGASGSGNVLLAGVTVGTYTEAGGLLTIKFASTGVTATTVDAVLHGIAYISSLPGNPLVPGIVIGAQIDDANNDPIALNGNTLDPTGPHDQGPGGDLLSNVLTATIDVQGTGPAVTFTEPNDSNPAAVAVAVDPTVDLSDIAQTGGTPSQVTLTIANPRAEDVLAFANTADIVGSYSTGTLTLTAVSGHTPTLAEWQAAIRSVQYYDTSAVPNTSTRDLTITLISGSNTASEGSTVAIIPVDDSPILNTSVTVSLADSTEYQGTGTPAPSGAVGSLVSQLAGLTGSAPGNVTDPDGPGLTNGAAPTAPGIAITSYSTADAGGVSVGTWYYSTNGGATWIAFPTTISSTQPLDLSSTARIAFQPTATDFNGQISNAITFRAWDGFDGTASGAQANLTGVSAFGQSAPINTPATAYSIASDTLPLMIDNVNNAPDAQGSVTLPPVSTSEQHPPGETVTQLFSGGFSDPLDNQYNASANPFGSTSNTFAGIAITGNAATHSQGVWEYSLDGGATWTAISTIVSQSNAVILPGDARLAFQPNGSFSGHPGELSVTLIDSSATPIAPGLSGAQLAAEGSFGIPLTAVTGVDIPVVGGSSAFSATTMTLGTLINPLPPIQPSAPTEAVGPLTSTFPDDLQPEPTGLGFWTTDDFLSRPLIPDLSLVGSVANRFIIVEQQAVISVPSNIFQDTMPDAQLSYDAKLPDGTSLPSWLTFNANDLTFTGTPPAGSYGRLEILITARDIAGNTADATFNILIGREQQDLVGLLGHGSHHPHLVLPRHAGDPAEGLRRAAAAVAHAEQELADHSVHGQAAERVSAQAALLARLPVPMAPSGAFSTALHAAGPLAALRRARAWLDTINDMDRQRPAA